MRLMPGLAVAVAAAALAGAAHAERICTAASPDPAIMVALHVDDGGAVTRGEVHWAVPNVHPELPSMVHIVFPLDGDRAGPRPQSVITLNAVTGDEIAKSPTASVQIVVDGMQMAVRAWGLYGQAVQQLTANPPEQGLAKASFVGAVTFDPRFEDGRRDVDSSEALVKLGRGAQTLEVRVLGQDGMTLQDHVYNLFDMATPPVNEVHAALNKAMEMARQPGLCQSY